MAPQQAGGGQGQPVAMPGQMQPMQPGQPAAGQPQQPQPGFVQYQQVHKYNYALQNKNNTDITILNLAELKIALQCCILYLSKNISSENIVYVA